MCTRQSRKIIWDMIDTVFLTTVAGEPTFVAFRYHSQTHFHGLSCHFFQISLKNSELKPPTMPFGIVACTFSDNLSRNSCKWKQLCLLWQLDSSLQWHKQWNLDTTNLSLYNKVLSIVYDFVYPRNGKIHYMEKYFDITKPRNSEQILPVPWHFVISRFHCRTIKD